MTDLRRNHRVLGRVVAEAAGFTVLQTGDHAYTAAPTIELLPVTSAEAEFTIRMALASVLEQARTLDVGVARVADLLREESEQQP